VLKELQGL
jgi:hypothetical protein